MKRGCRGAVAAVLIVGAAAVAAAGGGFSRRFDLGESGELTVRNTQRNAVWRPCVVAVVCPSAASRTVTVYRVAGALEYPVAQRAASAAAYVFEFEGSYWCDFSNGVKVAVSPACTGVVEVVYE